MTSSLPSYFPTKVLNALTTSLGFSMGTGGIKQELPLRELLLSKAFLFQLLLLNTL
jgi:hypothetical protein